MRLPALWRHFRELINQYRDRPRVGFVNPASRQFEFSRIYSQRRWGGMQAPSSGTGSSPAIAMPYADYVSRLIERVAASRVLDIGHGDWAMWPKDAFSTVQYVGIEVVPAVSQSVRLLHTRPGREFVCGDAVEMEWPRADIVLCKDVLQHLSNADVQLVLTRLAAFPLAVICHDVAMKSRYRTKSETIRWALRRGRLIMAPRARAKLLLRVQNPFQPLVLAENSDCATGGYRPLDLDKAPWSLNEFGFTILEQFDFPASNDPLETTAKRVWLLSSVGMTSYDHR